jgi:hypothetical protein
VDWWDRQTSTVEDWVDGLVGETDEGDPVPPALDSSLPVPTPSDTISPKEGSMTFLWKPVSNDGNAVTLFPWRYRWKEAGTDPAYAIERVFIRGGSRDGEEPLKIYHPKKLNDDGSVKDWTNGNRCHARWAKPGKKYGEDFQVVLGTEDGKSHEWNIQDGGDRREIR